MNPAFGASKSQQRAGAKPIAGSFNRIVPCIGAPAQNQGPRLPVGMSALGHKRSFVLGLGQGKASGI
jgi:hypothetical protein